jgi:hypothetical protein
MAYVATLSAVHSQPNSLGGLFGRFKGQRACFRAPGVDTRLWVGEGGGGSAKADEQPGGSTGVRGGIVGAYGGDKNLHLDVEGEKSRKR